MSEPADEFPDRVSSWSELSALLEHFSIYSRHDWLFRGVSDASFDLIPKIARPDIRAVTKRGTRNVRIPYSLDDEHLLMQMFYAQAASLLPSGLKVDFPGSMAELELMAVAQHFGLPTRMLDWTESFYVAVWFAVQKGGALKRNAAIWVTRDVPIRDPNPTAADADENVPFLYWPRHLSPRIGAQASVLMYCPRPTKPLVLPFRRQIVIDRAIQFTLKKRLNACGINERSMFPDLGGLAAHLAWLYKHDWLSGHRYRDSSRPSGDESDTTD